MSLGGKHCSLCAFPLSVISFIFSFDFNSFANACIIFPRFSYAEKDLAVEDRNVINGGPRWRSDETSDEEDEQSPQRSIRRGIRRIRGAKR